MLPLHNSLTSEAQHQIMRRVRDDNLLPQSNINMTMQHGQEGTNIQTTHATHEFRNLNNNNDLYGIETTNREFYDNLTQINNTENFIINPSISYEVGLKQGQLKALRIVENLLKYRMTIGRQHATGVLSNDFITEYTKNVAIVLLHGGPGYGKSHVLKCMLSSYGHTIFQQVFYNSYCF